MDADLKSAERRNYLSYFDDGIADAAGGLVVLLFGLGMTLDSGILFSFVWMPMLLLWPIKRWLTLPRIGYVKFAPERQHRITTGLTTSLGIGIAILLLCLAAFLGLRGDAAVVHNLAESSELLLLGTIMALPFALVALLFGIARFAAYAGLVLAGWLAGLLLPIEPGITVAGSGGIIVLIAFGLLFAFLSKYPVLSE